MDVPSGKRLQTTMERSTIFHGKIHERVRFTKYLKYLVGITWEGLGEILERLKLYEGKKT